MAASSFLQCQPGLLFLSVALWQDLLKEQHPTCFIFPTLIPLTEGWPQLSQLTGGAEGRMSDLLPFLLFIPLVCLVFAPACTSCHLIHAPLCLLCIFVKQYTAVAVTLLPSEKGLQYASQNAGQTAQQVEHLQSHMHANVSNDVACLGDL